VFSPPKKIKIEEIQRQYLGFLKWGRKKEKEKRKKKLLARENHVFSVPPISELFIAIICHNLPADYCI
jgi:hypothetical protein